MSSTFDSYHMWLGISPEEQPANHYRLLGLAMFEAEPDVIDIAANRQTSYLQSVASGPHRAEAQQLLNEIAQARILLLDEERKAEYDSRLRQQARDDTDTAQPELEEIPVALPLTDATSEIPEAVPVADGPVFPSIQLQKSRATLTTATRKTSTNPVLLITGVCVGLLAMVAAALHFGSEDETGDHSLANSNTATGTINRDPDNNDSPTGDVAPPSTTPSSGTGSFSDWTAFNRPGTAVSRAASSDTAVAASVHPPNQTLLIDFGPNNDDDGRATSGPDTNNSFWNNWRPTPGGAVIPAGTELADLVDTKQRPTTIQLAVTRPFAGANGITNGGLRSPDGPAASLLASFALETATEDYFFTTSESAFKVTGLDASRTYTFRVFGTRSAAQRRETAYIIVGGNGEHSATLVTSGTNIGSDGEFDGNDDTIATVNGVAPDENGEVLIELRVLSGGFAYIGIMEIVSED